MMAKIRGKAGKFTGEKTARLRRSALLLAFVMVGILGLAEGITLSSLWAKLNPPRWITTVVQLGGLVAVGSMSWWGLRKLDQLDAERIKWQRGDQGETAVGKILAELSDAFEVINDLKVPGQNANLDHVVVGPTGVFILDAKNCRGLVTADGYGELLINGEPPSNCGIKKFVARYMEMRKRVCPLTPDVDVFWHGVFVFTSAWVSASWGTTGKVNCMTHDQLKNYIEKPKFGKPVTAEQVKQIADALWQVATSEELCIDKATESIRPGPPAAARQSPVAAVSTGGTLR